MKHTLNGKVWGNRSQQVIRHPNVIIPNFNSRLTKTVDQFIPARIQHPHPITKDPVNDQDEFEIVDKAKETQTGKWVLNVIAAREEYQKVIVPNTNLWYTDTKQETTKKQSFQSKKSTKVEPIQSSTQFIHTKLHTNRKKHKHHKTKTPLPKKTKINLAETQSSRRTPLSSFSSATQIDDTEIDNTEIDDTESLEESMVKSRQKTMNESRDCSEENFRDSDKKACIPKRIMVIISIIASVLIVGIIIALLVIIFTKQNSSIGSSATSKELRLAPIPPSSQNLLICPTPIFNVTDLSCNGTVSYNYYSCYQIATSNSCTLRFTFEHDTLSGHWCFDDISAVQYNNIQLIINGDFESNLTGWIVNISSSDSTSDIHVDTTTDLANVSSAYLYATSQKNPSYIEQTFQVIQGEYLNVSFWWKYNGSPTVGSTCSAIGQLIISN